jgi:hypothetical protein
MKRLGTVLFLCVLCAEPLLAAEKLTDIALYFEPTSGGSPEERAFFDACLPEEIKNAYYKVVESQDEADFLVSSAINANEGPDPSSRFTLGLMTAADSSFVLELSWDYVDMEELYFWDIGSILAPGVSPETVEATGFRWGQSGNRLYLGVRGGVSFGGYSFQSTAEYNGGYGMGINAEGGLAVELRLLRFLSVQGEGNFVYESFKAPLIGWAGSESASDSFAAMSLMFPLMAKAPMKFGKFALSLYAGGYYAMMLGEAEKTSEDSGSTERVAAAALDPAFGYAAGMELGFSLGPGEFFTDVRHWKNFGPTAFGTAGPLFLKDRTSLCFGYRWGFFKQGTRNREQGIGNKE